MESIKGSFIWCCYAPNMRVPFSVTLGFGLLIAAVPTGAANVVASKAQLWPSRTVEFLVCDQATAEKLGRKYCARQAQKGGGRGSTAVLATQEAATVRQTVKTWNREFGSNIRFKEVKEPGQRNLVIFRASARPTRCSTQRVGYLTEQRRKFISIGARCSRKGGPGETGIGTVAHEMMHAVGFYHEQQRPDRPSMLKVKRSIASGRKAHQWKPVCAKKCEGKRAGETVGSYDFSSIMHYSLGTGSKAAAKPTASGTRRLKKQELRPRDVGQRVWLSQTDVRAIKKLYPAWGKTVRS